MLDSSRRFSNRVENYLKYRPRYPAEIIPLLERECGLTKESVIADIGSGTGFLTELFLQHGNVAYGVEPNDEMRAAGEDLLDKFTTFHSIKGTAEGTTLATRFVDFVIAGQAFHWFNPPAARAEFLRILKSHGWVILVWNTFRVQWNPVNRAYHELLVRYGTDYKTVGRDLDFSELQEFYAPGVCRFAKFTWDQSFDYPSFEGRLLSSSFVPLEGQPNYEEMLNELRRIFDSYQKSDVITFAYETQVYYGRLVSSY